MNRRGFFGILGAVIPAVFGCARMRPGQPYDFRKTATYLGVVSEQPKRSLAYSHRMFATKIKVSKEVLDLSGLREMCAKQMRDDLKAMDRLLAWWKTG